MRKHVCDEREYLKVEYETGITKHIQGPTSLFEDPTEILRITKHSLYKLSASEMIVVYREERPLASEFTKPSSSVGYTEVIGDSIMMASKAVAPDRSSRVVRTNIQGPCLYMVKETEWLHDFSWHGPQKDNKAHHDAGTRNFDVLKITPENLYYNVRDVRTSDDAIVSVKLMMFYHISDVEKMLDSTQDPIGDFLNAVCADVISFASTRDYETLLEDSRHLNDMENYAELRARAGEIGMRVTKVVYRGHHASAAIEKAHSAASAMRTKMRLESDVAREEQNLLDMKLAKEATRASAEREVKLRQLEHEIELKDMRHRAEREAKKQDHVAMLQEKKREQEAELVYRCRRSEARLAEVTELHKLGLDVTRYLCNPVPDRHVHITGGVEAPSMQLHEQLQEQVKV